jgi:hypothetical protein
LLVVDSLQLLFRVLQRLDVSFHGRHFLAQLVHYCF